MGQYILQLYFLFNQKKFHKPFDFKTEKNIKYYTVLGTNQKRITKSSPFRSRYCHGIEFVSFPLRGDNLKRYFDQK